MGTTRPSTRALPANKVLELFEQLLSLSPYQGPCTLEISTGVNMLQWSFPCLHGKPQKPNELAIAKEYLTRNTMLACDTCLLYQRETRHCLISYSCSDGVVGHVELSGFDGRPEVAQTIFERLTEVFHLSMFADLIGWANTEETSLQIRERAVVDLASATQKLEDALVKISIEDFTRRQKLNDKLQDALDIQRAELQAEFDKKKQSLDRRHQEATEALQREREEHNKRVAEVDARAAQIARRSQHKNLDELLKEHEKLQLSSETGNKRNKTERSIWAMIGATAAVALLSGYYLFFADADLQWRHAVPFASSTFATWATLSYYIRWNDRWTRDHAAVEMLSRRYRADAVRANWLAEWVSEAFERGNTSPLPPDMIAAFTRNLFADPATAAEALHPLERLVDQARELELGKDKVRITSGK